MVENTGAEAAGIKKGDLLISIDGQAIDQDHSVRTILSTFKAGDQVSIEIERNGVTQIKEVTLSTRPSSQKSTRTITIHKEFDTDKDATNDGAVVPTNVLELRDFEAFPNPNDGILQVQFKGAATPITVQLTDMEGKQLFHQHLMDFSGNYNESLDLSTYPTGTLLLVIEQNGQMHTERVVHQ